MKIKHLIVTSILISSFAHAMDEQDEKPVQPIPTTSFQTLPIPQAMHITGFDTPILFNGKVNTLFNRLNNRHKNKFGNTLVAYLGIGTAKTTYEQKGCVRDLKQEEMTRISNGQALYVTNIENKQIDGVPLAYGAIVITNQSNNSFTHNEKHIYHILNVFQGFYLIKNPKK